MKKTFKFLPLLAASAVVVGCNDYDFGVTADAFRQKEYAENFAKAFGETDPNQDWSMATLVTANVNLPEISGVSKMNIMTGDPRNAETRLLAQIMLQDGQGSIDFDALKGQNYVFVTVEQDDQYKVFGQYSIVNGFLGIGDVQMPMTRVGVGNVTEVSSFSSTCPTTQRTGTTATVDYTYFNNIRSTTEIAGIKYPGDANYENSDVLKTLEEWVAFAKANVTYANNTLTNYSPFTDESIASFVKVSGSDFTGLTADNMKDGCTTNEEVLITYNLWGTPATKTLQEWIAAAKNGNATPSNYQYNNGGAPFEPTAVITSCASWDDVDWTEVSYKSGVEVVSAGTVITYNGTSKSLAGWQADAAANVDAILAGSYNGPWPNDVLKACITTTPCSKSDAGAIYNGLTDESTWELKENTKTTYKFVNPTFQYLDNVEQSSSPAITLGDFNSFFGDGNFFAESVSVWDNTKLGKYYDEATMRKMENGYSIVTTANQVIELPYVFGCTAYSNQFGYIYYKEADEDNIDPISLKHYVLIEDGRPSQNIYRDQWKTGTAVASSSNNYAADKYYTYNFTDENGNPTFSGNYITLEGAKDDPFVCNCNESSGTGIYSAEHKHLSTCYSPADRYAQIAAKSFYGTTYRPMFFGEDGNASQGTYEWPEGYKIVFWINTLAESDQPTMLKTHPADRFTSSGGMGGHFNYSLPTINKRLFHNYQGTLTHTEEELKTLGQVQCISWTLDGTTFLAFGDMSGDKDLNDMVFMVSAPNSDPENTVVTVPVKWHLNYNSQHEDNDLFANETLNQGANYTNPKKSDGTNSEPTRVGYEFVGWSTDPTASAGDKSVTGTVPTNSTAAINYYAVWAPIGKSYTITWHKNYDPTIYASDCGKDDPETNAADIHKQQVVGENETFTKPNTNPTAPSEKVFKGWSLTPTGDILPESWFENPTNMTATGDDENICFYAIYEDAPTPGPDPEAMTWIFACEDLGGVYDYDFNDVVWSVKHVAGQTNVTVELLAAGGTLPFSLNYGSTKITTKLEALGQTDTPVIPRITGKTYNLTVESTWTLEANKQNFNVVVETSGTSSVVSTYQRGEAKGKTPQVLILPETWQWPDERVSIETVYPGFKAWTGDATNYFWYVLDNK